MGNKKRAFFALSFLATLMIFAGDLPYVSAVGETKTVFIAETMANPDGTDGKENEYIILKNITATEINLADYKLCNIKNYCYSPNFKLAAGACSKIFRSTFLFTLYNDEEKISLFDSAGGLKDEVYFKTAPSGKPWVCDENNCDFSLPVPDCGYLNIFEIETPEEVETLEAEFYSQTENLNANIGSKNVTTANTNSNLSNKKSVVSSSNENTNKNPAFQIKNRDDFRTAKKIIQKSKETLPVSLSAQAVIPKNVLGKNTFYLLSEGEWLNGQMYTSFCKINNCDDLDILLAQRSFFRVENAYLNWNGERFSLGLGKLSRVTREESSKDNLVNLDNLEPKKLRKKLGRKIEAEGEIVLKKGSYFYVKTVAGKILNFYVPTQVLTDWLAERKSLIKDVFPDYETEKNWPTLLYKGAKMRAIGVIEAEKKSYRIVVTSFRDLNFEWQLKESASLSGQKNKVAERKNPNNENINKQNSVTELKEDGDSQKEKVADLEKPESLKSLNKLLAGRLPWADLIKIFSLKIWPGL